MLIERSNENIRVSKSVYHNHRRRVPSDRWDDSSRRAGHDV